MFNLGYMHEQGLGMKKDWHLAKRLYDLAAETNADAKIPVALALLKLQLLMKLESLKNVRNLRFFFQLVEMEISKLDSFFFFYLSLQSPFKVLLHLDENIASNWDLYLITILTLALGMIIYTRRPPAPTPTPAQQQQSQPSQQQTANNNNNNNQREENQPNPPEIN